MCVGKAVPNISKCASPTMAAPRLPDGHVGHILIRGPSVTRGYFGDPEATRTHHRLAGWVDTGDLGFQHEGNLYIAGRSKEIIFINGRITTPTIWRTSRTARRVSI
jgi:fatty-acyl-CoA synthase